MTTGTHISFYFFLSNLFGIPLKIEHIIAGIIGTLLPDIDNPKGGIGRIPNPLTNYIFRKYGHRTITHSWIMIALPTLTFPITYLLQVQEISWILIFAITTHILLDANNFNGVQLFYPKKLIAVLPMDNRFRTELGSSREKHIIAVFIFLAIITTPIGIIGYSKIINYFAASQRAAIKDYKDAVDKYLLTIKLGNSINRITQENINNKQFTAIAIMENNDILIEDEQQNRLTVGRSNDAIIYIEQINVFPQEPIKTFKHTYDITQTGWDTILKALSYKNSYAYGEVMIENIPEENLAQKTAQFYHGVEYKHLQDQYYAILKYASLKDIVMSGLTSTTPLKGEIVVKGIENTPNYYKIPETEISKRIISMTVPMSILDIKVSTGQTIKKGEIIAEDKAEIYVLDKKISELRSKINTVKISIDDKPDTLIDKSLSLEKDILMLDTKIKAQEKLIEQIQLKELPNIDLVIEGEETRLENLREQMAIKQKEYNELKRVLEEKSKYIKDTAVSQSQEIMEKINVIEAEKEKFRWRTPYNGKVKSIKSLKNWPNRTVITIEILEV